MVYLIIVPKRGKKLPQLGFHFSPSQDCVVRGWDLVFAAARVGSFRALGLALLRQRTLLGGGLPERTEPTAEPIRYFVPPLESRVIVVVDSSSKGWRSRLRSSIAGEGRGGGRWSALSLAISCQQILRHLKRRWGVEVMFKMLKEHFGLGDCRCRGRQSLERWVELVLLAYVLAGLTRWGSNSWGRGRARGRFGSNGDGV